VTKVTTIVALGVAAAALLAAPAGGTSPLVSRRCPTLVSVEWTSTAQGRVTHGQGYRVDSRRLPCFLVRRLAAQLIPLRTTAAFAAARPVGYVCAALGTAANPFRPATAIGFCLQKPLGRPPERSFTWRPLAGSS
jgi:hypothetical protein